MVSVSGGSGAESSTEQPTQVSGTITAVDPDGDALTYTVLADGLGHHGTLSVDGSGHFVFTANDADWYGNDSFTVQIADGRGGSVDQVIDISVTPTDDVPPLSGGVAMICWSVEQGRIRSPWAGRLA
ncbi:MAG: cadherin-like domain-containing protein [Magnetospirillum sp.]|nr:cadherin-like domain-containing protein [Magnetospirillum sp.]